MRAERSESISLWLQVHLDRKRERAREIAARTGTERSRHQTLWRAQVRHLVTRYSGGQTWRGTAQTGTAACRAASFRVRGSGCRTKLGRGRQSGRRTRGESAKRRPVRGRCRGIGCGQAHSPRVSSVVAVCRIRSKDRALGVLAHFGPAVLPASELSNTILSTAISHVSRIAALSCFKYLRRTGSASSEPIAPIASAAWPRDRHVRDQPFGRLGHCQLGGPVSTDLVSDHNVLVVVFEDFGQDGESARVLELPEAVGEFMPEECRFAIEACFEFARSAAFSPCCSIRGGQRTFCDDLDGSFASEALESEQGAEPLSERNLGRVELAVETRVDVFVGRRHGCTGELGLSAIRASSSSHTRDEDFSHSNGDEKTRRCRPFGIIQPFADRSSRAFAGLRGIQGKTTLDDSSAATLEERSLSAKVIGRGCCTASFPLTERARASAP